MTDELDHTRRYQVTEEDQRGRRRPGLAVDVLGWPWHPRRLATARYRGQHGGHGSGDGPGQNPPAVAELFLTVTFRLSTARQRGPLAVAV